jgi:ankyrin repeat protein
MVPTPCIGPAYVGISATVSLLLKNDAEIDDRCSDFGATPLFWAAQGFSQYGPKVKHDQIGAAKVLISAGANVNTMNCEHTSLLKRAADTDSPAMRELLGGCPRIERLLRKREFWPIFPIKFR